MTGRRGPLLRWSDEFAGWTGDRPYHTQTPRDVPGGVWPFRHEFFLLLNLAIGGNWPSNEGSDPPLPATLLIDWIRWYDAGSP